MNGKNDVAPLHVYLDTNVFIEMWEKTNSQESNAIWKLIGMGIDKDWRFVSSELALAEILVHPIATAKETGDWRLADVYRENIADKEPFQRIVPVSRAILESAANVRSENASIKLPDAIHLATALGEGCKIVISNDERLIAAIRKSLVPGQFETVLTFAELSNPECAIWTL